MGWQSFHRWVGLAAHATVASSLGWNEKETTALSGCPCSDKSLCLPVARTPRFEVFAFSPSINSTNWRYYDFDTLTTIAWNLDKDLLCYAHARQVKIVIQHNFDQADRLCDPAARADWIEATYTSIVENYADGVNIDTEVEMSGSTAKCQTLLVQELRVRLAASKFTHNAQISFDVPWSPHGVDQRYYDWVGLAAHADFLFVMSYDIRSQIYYQCIAGANSPLALVRRGVEEYIAGYGISPRQLVLGLPWYAYNYPCESMDNSICHIRPVPFRGAPCSDAAGHQIDYSQVQALLVDPTAKLGWDVMSSSPFISLRTNQTTAQVWYDNDRSLALKYNLATHLNLRGVGMWHVDALDYSGKANPIVSTQAMWQTLRNAVPAVSSDLTSIA
ncbi:hypothetical protein H310_07391 [Aphanomyces invadans]|uniref:GH18 domain-containing protein n=1 Tax=Aphanomyces invadans TaxID=157072 RepID=A0A024U391_9STRA|nr:hypothetical protein H310_07391 [Aphanomyces invadans]ETW00871.1 hypothetical protein H310_07391 [Aphanomyces invadans]|eukprot:XP_008871006.1 hypothetical protein H310_07391 [Aphanomyces invadans]